MSSTPKLLASNWRTSGCSWPTRMCSFMIPCRASFPSRYQSVFLVKG